MPPMIAPNSIDGPYNDACFQFKRGPVSLRAKGSAVGVNNGSHGAVLLLLLKCSSKTIDAIVGKHAERAGVALHSVLIGGKNKRGGTESSARSSRTMASMLAVNANLTPCFKKVVSGWMRSDIFLKNVQLCDRPSRRKQSFFMSRSYGNEDQGRQFLRVRAHAHPRAFRSDPGNRCPSRRAESLRGKSLK